MIVVSDTTPLNYLILINAIDVLPRLFDDVFVPSAVLQELLHPKAPQPVRQWAISPPAWIKVQNPLSRLPSTARLDPGESDAISLAKQLQIVDILLDERRATRIARQEGLIPLPTLAIIEEAAEEDLLDLPKAIELLRQTTMRVPQDQMDAALQRDTLRRQFRKQSP